MHLKKSRDLIAELKESSGRLEPSEFKKLQQFASLLLKCFEMDPSKRITPEQALQHEFIQG
jgi:serine/threonine protein kinase